MKEIKKYHLMQKKMGDKNCIKSKLRTTVECGVLNKSFEFFPGLTCKQFGWRWNVEFAQSTGRGSSNERRNLK